MTTETTQQGVSQEQQLHAALADGLIDEPEQREEEEEQPRDEAAEETTDEAPEGGDEAEEAEVSTLDDLAEQLGWDKEKLLNLKAKLKVDGQEEETTLAQLLKINQLEGHVNKKSIELAEQRKAFEAEQAKQMQAWQERIGIAASVLDAQEQALQQAYQQLAAQQQSEPWDQLFATDQQQYAARQLRYQQAFQQLQMQYAGVQQHKAQIAQSYQQTQQQFRESARPKAREAIVSAFPEYADPASYSNALADMKAYLKTQGAQESSFDMLELDPVVFKIVRDAVAYHKASQARAGVEKRVKEAPKVVKPGAKQELNHKSRELRQHFDRLKKTGDVDELGAIFAKTL
ncbi:MAG TPA: hypothetical protein VF217_03530 [Rhodanobacteraceae bacterium]